MKPGCLLLLLALFLPLSFALPLDSEIGISRIFVSLGLSVGSQRILADSGFAVFEMPKGGLLEFSYQKFNTAKESENEIKQMQASMPVMSFGKPPVNVGGMAIWSASEKTWYLGVQSGSYIFTLYGTKGEALEKGKELAVALNEYFSDMK